MTGRMVSLQFCIIFPPQIHHCGTDPLVPVRPESMAVQVSPTGNPSAVIQENTGKSQGRAAQTPERARPQAMPLGFARPNSTNTPPPYLSVLFVPYVPVSSPPKFKPAAESHLPPKTP